MTPTYSATDFGKAALFGGLVFGGLVTALGFYHHGKAALAVVPIVSAVISGGVIFAGTNYFYNKHLAKGAGAAPLTATATTGNPTT